VSEPREIEGGIAKILKKGTAEPSAVRFHVPRAEGGWSQVTWGEVLDRCRQVALWLDDQGAGLEREVKELFLAAGIQMIEGYGMTECSPNLTMNRLDDYDFDSVGKPMPGVTLKLAEDSTRRRTSS